MKMNAFILFTVALTQTSFAANATTTAAKNGKQVFKTAPVLADGTIDADVAGSAFYQKFMAQWKIDHANDKPIAANTSPRRNPAGENLESQLKPKFVEIRNKIQSIATGDDLATYFETLKATYATIPTEDREAKMLASELIEFSYLRGIVYRLVPLVNNRKMDHSVALTFVMRIADSMSLYFPYPQWKAAFQFLTEPYDNCVQFTNDRNESGIHKFQNFVNTVLYEAARTSIKDLEAIDFSTPLIWDNTIFTGQNTLPDSRDHYSLIQYAEQQALIAVKYNGLAAMNLFVAYDYDDLFNVSKDLSNLYISDAIITLKDVQGVTAKDVTDKIKAYPNFGRRYRDGTHYLTDALTDMQASMTYLMRAYNNLQADKNNDRLSHSVINRGLTDLYKTDLDNTIPTWNEIINGPKELSSRVVAGDGANKKVTVNYPAFITNLPADLKTFLPTNFEDNTDASIWSKKTVKMGSDTITANYHNYFRGAGRAWSHKAYQYLYSSPGELTKLAASAPDVGEEKIKDYQRILMQSWGGKFVGFPLSIFFF